MKSPIILPVHIAYGALALFIAILNNVFLLFYVTTFVKVYHIDSVSFYVGETIFLIWNSVNDPIFGWLSDRDALKNDNQGICNHVDAVLRRIDALSKFGPLFALSFLLFWFKFLPVGIQFSIALCLYDSFLTMVDLHHQALLADLSIKAEDRVKLNYSCSMLSAAGSLSVFMSFALWDAEDMFKFQLLCIFLTSFVCIGFWICCDSMKSFYEKNMSKKDSHNNHKQVIGSVSLIKNYTYQILRHKNFLIFSCMNLVQVFHCHFNSNFFPLFIQYLLGHTLSPSAGAILIGLSFLVPHLNNLYFLQLCSKHGTYLIIKTLFFIKLILPILMWMFGMNYWYILCVFILSNRVFTEGTCKLLNLVISDLVDEDFVKFKRKSPVSALVFGTSALLSKPGQTFAPLIGSYMFYVKSNKSFFFSDGTVTALNSEHNFQNSESELLKEACFSILVLVPIGCAILQLFIWNFYSLKGKYLYQIKNDRLNQEYNYSNLDIV